MIIRSEAEENLRVIRSLLERATVYRAISAPSALVGGLLSMIAGLVLHVLERRHPGSDHEHAFLIGWFIVLLLTGVANTVILWRDARRRGDPFFSSGMRLALGALLPNCLAAAVLTFVFWKLGIITCLPAFWMLFYGTGLLATSHFAPRSIVLLGWAFLLASFVSFGLLTGGSNYTLAHANIFMVLTFGGFHLFYAGSTWPRKQP
jgi:hypothetical protein